MTQHLGSAGLVKCIRCIDGDAYVRRVPANLDKDVSSVVDNGVEAIIDAAAHLEWRQVWLCFSDRGRYADFGDEEPQDGHDRVWSDICSSIFQGNEVGSENLMADRERELASRELLRHSAEHTMVRSLRPE